MAIFLMPGALPGMAIIAGLEAGWRSGIGSTRGGGFLKFYFLFLIENRATLLRQGYGGQGAGNYKWAVVPASPEQATPWQVVGGKMLERALFAGPHWAYPIKRVGSPCSGSWPVLWRVPCRWTFCRFPSRRYAVAGCRSTRPVASG